MSTWVGDSNLKDDSLLRSQKLFLLLFLSGAITLLPLEQVTQATQGKKIQYFHPNAGLRAGTTGVYTFPHRPQKSIY